MRSPTHGTFRRNSPNVGTCVPRTSLPTNFSERRGEQLGGEQLEDQHDREAHQRLAVIEVVGVEVETACRAGELEYGERQPQDRGQEHEQPA